GLADLRREPARLAVQRAHANRRWQRCSPEPAMDLPDWHRARVRDNAARVRWADVHRGTLEQFLGARREDRQTHLALPENTAVKAHSLLRRRESRIRRRRR